MALSGRIESSYLEIRGPDPWPDDVQLFQPFEVDQIILPESASCWSVQAFLRICGLYFKVESRTNAEHMSPSGIVPFIKCGNYVISELEPIVGFVNNKIFHLSDHLEDAQRADMLAYMALVNEILVNAELYVSWINEECYQNVTKLRYGSIYPWPLNQILPASKRWKIKKRLKTLKWLDKNIEEVVENVDSCCRALSDRLDDNEYFFSAKPTELDALVFGHIYAILKSDLPGNHLKNAVKRYGNLTGFCAKIAEKVVLD